jgi:hypothetical protein
MILAETFEAIDAVEIAIMLAIPAFLIFLLVRSFRQPKANAKGAAETRSTDA